MHAQVGYGDLSPEGAPMQAFTVVMIFVGVCFVFSQITAWIGALTGPLTARARQSLDRLFPEDLVDIDGDGLADYRVPHAPVPVPACA